jgi:hypothetical protein
MSRTDVVHRRTGPPGSPLKWSDTLHRRIRCDGLETLGVSTQTLAERSLEAGDWDVAVDLAQYFLDEMTRINDALFTWLTVILPFRAELVGRTDDDEGRRVVEAMRGFGPGDGDLAAVLEACARQDADAARARLELLRVRVAAVHDQLVWWIQQLLSDMVEQHGEDSVRDVVLRTYDVLWKVRYAEWNLMTPEERLQISVEGMRGHLSGPRHRGDVGILDEGDRLTMVLDPCGSCGVLRRGDPDSGRPPCNPAGTATRHPWAWNELGVGWYAVHSPIAMEWIDMREGRPPLRPLEGCDQEGPCRWFIYKNPHDARPEHYVRMGFAPPTKRVQPG